MLAIVVPIPTELVVTIPDATVVHTEDPPPPPPVASVAGAHSAPFHLRTSFVDGVEAFTLDRFPRD